MKKILIFSIVIFLLVFIGCKEKTDIEFAKDFFEKLAEGKTSVIDDIDWENFSGTGFDIGGKFKGTSDDEEIKNLKKSFIYLFSDSFKKSGLSIGKFANWIIEDENEYRTIISSENELNSLLYIVISKKLDKKKIISIIISNPDFRFSKEFIPTRLNEITLRDLLFETFPASLIEKYYEYEIEKEKELIKKSGYSKRVGITFKTDSRDKVFGKKYKSSEDFFDSNGNTIKTITYDEKGKSEETKIELTKKSSEKRHTINLVDDKIGLYEEKSNNSVFYYNNSVFYYTILDSGYYNIRKVIIESDTRILKYNNKKSLTNMIMINEFGKYRGMFTVFYDSLENVKRKIIYLPSGILEDSIYNTKYSPSGKVIEEVRFNAPGKFDIKCFFFYKCYYKYDKNDNLLEKSIGNLDQPGYDITYFFNSNKKISAIEDCGNFYPFFPGIYKFNKEGLLIEGPYNVLDLTPLSIYGEITQYYYYK